MRGGRVPTKILRNTAPNYTLMTDGPSKYSLIWLHGLGGEAEHYVSFFSHTDSTLYKGCRVRLLQAPKRYTTINEQQDYSWYDLRSFKRFTQPQDLVFNFDHIRDSHAIIHKHFEEEVAHWRQSDPGSKLDPSKRVYIGGMSQGGVMSLYFGLSSLPPPAGVISFSGYLLRSASLNNLASLPMLLVHGHRDGTIRQADARNSYKSLLESAKTEYRTIKKLDHSVCLEQIGLIRDWIQSTHKKHEEAVI